MKKNILSVIVLLVFTIVNAQDTKFGIKGGANISVFGNKVKSKIGFQAGVFTKIELSDKLYFQPELLFMQQELKRDNFTYIGVTGSGNIKISYINVPILFKYNLVQNLFVEMGPQFGYILKAKAVVVPTMIPDDLDGIEIGVPIDMDVEDKFKKLDLGMNVGAGYEISEKVSLDLRYNIGITKMAKSDYVANLYNRNSFISLSLGYAF